MNIKKFLIVSLNKKHKASLAALFKDIGKTLIIGLMVNIFLEVKDMTVLQGISAGFAGIELYFLGMLFEEGED